MRAESVFVTTTAVNTPRRPWSTGNYERMLRAAHAYRGTDFRLAEDPEDADFLLFVDSTEPYLGDVWRSHLFHRYHDRSFVHNGNDAAVPVLPGMYPDVIGPVRLPDQQLGAFYLRPFDNQLLVPPPNDAKQPTRLFSFVGNVKNAPEVRGRILALQNPDAVLLNRSSGIDLDYVEMLRDFDFILCPRGLGPTSWRFYEVMMAARVPVIISDGWVPARDIDWASCSLRVSESDIEFDPQPMCRECRPGSRDGPARPSGVGDSLFTRASLRLGRAPAAGAAPSE